MSRALNALWLAGFIGATVAWRLTAPRWVVHDCSPLRTAATAVAAAWVAFAVADWLSGACTCNDVPATGGSRAYALRIARCCVYGIALALDVGTSVMAWPAVDGRDALVSALVLQTSTVSVILALDWASRYTIAEYRILPTTGNWRKLRIAVHALASLMLTAAVGVFAPYVTPRPIVPLCVTASVFQIDKN